MLNEARYEYIIGILTDLININTTKSANNETEAARYLQEKCQIMGMECELYEPFRGKGSLVATINGRKQDSIALYCHLDTDDCIDIDSWQFSPLEATSICDCIFGRGAIDCKGLAAVWMGVLDRIIQEEIVPQKTIKFFAVCDEESGGEKGLRWLIDNTNHFENINLVLSEGGGFPVQSDEKTYFTVQTGERERITIKKSYNKKNILENLNQVAIEEGIEAKAFNLDTKDYLTHVKSENNLKKKRKIDTENFYNFMFDYHEDNIFIYKMPFTGMKDIVKEEYIIEHMQTGPVKDLSCYLDIIQKKLLKIDDGYRILPFVTPGFSDNRYFRLQGIDTIGFFPLDINNHVSGVHGINEYITKESIELSVEILYHLIKSIAF
ncbi:MAG TPA: hypothetical protein DDX29_08760 [Clostridiales bacterium]|nr:hypothetical protein [Clostridiales bacterium]